MSIQYRSLAAMAALGGLLSLLAVTQAAPAPVATCHGLTATITGTAAEDRIVGTPGADVIVARGGSDLIRGGEGDDAICAGDGKDVVHGGDGGDALWGQGRSDTLEGGGGPDRLWGGAGRDYEFGERGTDTLEGGGTFDGHDVLIGGRGFDTANYEHRHSGVVVEMGEAPDPFACGAEDSTEAEEVLGGDGNDKLVGDSTDNVLAGGDGSDVLAGKAGDDTLRGDAGDDILVGGTGTNDIDGGTGTNQTCQSLGTCDVTAPRLEAFAIEHDEVSTGGQTATVTFRARLTDDLAGPNTMYIGLRGPNGVWNQSAQWVGRPCPAKEPATVEATATLPAYSPQGTWTVEAVWLGDLADNQTALETAELAANGFETTFKQTAPGDSSPPTITNVSFAATSIDTSSDKRAVTLRFHATDDVSGVNPETLWVEMRAPTGTSLGFSDKLTTTLVSGTKLDGDYEATFALPRHSPQGEWVVEILNITDHARNRLDIRDPELTNAGLNASFMQTGAGDSQPPELVDLSFSPREIDTSTSQQVINFTVRLRDDLSGVGRDNYVMVLYFSNGQKIMNVPILTYDRISGNALDGVYGRGHPVAKYSAQGVWTLDDAIIFDNVGNQTRIWRAQLEAAGFPTTFVNGP